MRSGLVLRGLAGAAILGGLVLPVALGLGHGLLAGFGHFPALGAQGPDLQPWRDLLATPGLGRAVALSLWTGIAATAIATVLAFGTLAALQDRGWSPVLRRILAPLLAAPHAALAIGLAFVLAPSGWIARGLAPAFGWTRPPDAATVGDPYGLALILGLAAKELPFLVLIIMGATTQIPVRAHLATGRALGYGRVAIWLWALVPQLWPLIRLPVMAVLAFSVSVVDMPMILGPSNPPTLSVLVARMFGDPDLRAILPASAGGVLQLALTLLAFAALLGTEQVLRLAGRVALRRGTRALRADRALPILAALAAVLVLLAGLALVALLVWSATLAWRWPDLWPSDLSLRAWSNSGRWSEAAANSALIGLASTVLALVTAVAWLESGDRLGRRGQDGGLRAALYGPLLLPQISFLIGLAGIMIHGPVSPLAAVIWGHWLFVFPYVMIALADPWAALDPRFDRTAAALGAGPSRRLWRVKLPILLAPVATAAAVGFAVSIAQYLPTLFLGGGRVVTLTTEAVASSSGSDRRVGAVYAVLQAALPWAMFLAALVLPAALHRDRRALRGAS